MRPPSLCCAALLCAGLAGCFAAPRYHGPRSDHFDGRHFFDGKSHVVGVADVLRWQTHRERGLPWPHELPAAPAAPPPARVGRGALRVTFINHATLLVQCDGVNVLTDPIYAERASPLRGVGPRRVRPPGVPFAMLPAIDVVLISHNHYDHLDLDTLRRLWERDHPVLVVGLGNAALLRGAGIARDDAAAIRELDWWQGADVRGLRVTSVPSQHASRRGLGDADATLWTAFVVEGPQAGGWYFAGDTGYGPHFRATAARFPGLRLALLPIGAFRPRWFMAPNHMSPQDAVQAHQDLGAAHSVPMHFGTFDLADEGIDEPLAALRERLASEPALADAFWVLGFGEGRDVPAGVP